MDDKFFHKMAEEELLSECPQWLRKQLPYSDVLSAEIPYRMAEIKERMLAELAEIKKIREIGV